MKNKHELKLSEFFSPALKYQGISPIQLSRRGSTKVYQKPAFLQYNSPYPFSNQLGKYPSIRCPTKPEIANSSYQLYSFVSHSPTFQWPVSWLSSINSVSNSHFSLDCISSCLSTKHCKQLQWRFQLIFHATILVQTSSQHSLPKETIMVVFFTCTLCWTYQSQLIGFTTQRFNHQLTQYTKY